MKGLGVGERQGRAAIRLPPLSTSNVMKMGCSPAGDYHAEA